MPEEVAWNWKVVSKFEGVLRRRKRVRTVGRDEPPAVGEWLEQREHDLTCVEVRSGHRIDIALRLDGRRICANKNRLLPLQDRADRTLRRVDGIKQEVTCCSTEQGDLVWSGVVGTEVSVVRTEVLVLLSARADADRHAMELVIGRPEDRVNGLDRPRLIKTAIQRRAKPDRVDRVARGEVASRNNHIADPFDDPSEWCGRRPAGAKRIDATADENQILDQRP